MATKSLDVSGLPCLADEWLSSVTGWNCYNVAFHDFHQVPLRLGYPSALYTARVNVNDVYRSSELMSRGFRLVETTLTLRREHQATQTISRRGSDGISIAAAESSDLHGVTHVAHSAFRQSRFHADPWFPNRLADLIKVEWSGNLVLGRRGTGCLVAKVDGATVGFLGYQHVDFGDDAAVIDLIAVDASAQSQGIGTALVLEFLQVASASGRPAQVGTQVSNSRAVRVYERLGFRLTSANYVLHGHVADREPS